MDGIRNGDIREKGECQMFGRWRQRAKIEVVLTRWGVRNSDYISIQTLARQEIHGWNK